MNGNCIGYEGNYQAFTSGCVVRNVIQLEEKNEPNVEIIKNIESGDFKARHITDWS